MNAAGQATLQACAAADALGLVAPPAGYWLALPAIVAAYLASAQLLKHWLALRYGQL